MYTATQDNDIRFNRLHDDNSRIRYKDMCELRRRLKRSVKGYEYDDSKYVVITDEEIEKIKTEKKSQFRFTLRSVESISTSIL